MKSIGLFGGLESIADKCPKCEILLEYGINTKFDQKKNKHVCECGEILD